MGVQARVATASLDQTVKVSCHTWDTTCPGATGNPQSTPHDGCSFFPVISWFLFLFAFSSVSHHPFFFSVNVGKGYPCYSGKLPVVCRHLCRCFLFSFFLIFSLKSVLMFCVPARSKCVFLCLGVGVVLWRAAPVCFIWCGDHVCDLRPQWVLPLLWRKRWKYFPGVSLQSGESNCPKASQPSF